MYEEPECNLARLANEQLGPKSYEALLTPKGQLLLSEASRHFRQPLDQVLWVVYSCREESPGCWGEFLNYFFEKLPRDVIQDGFPNLRSRVDTLDVFSDIFLSLQNGAKFEFKGEKPTISWLKRRFKWNAMNLAKKQPYVKEVNFGNGESLIQDAQVSQPHQILINQERGEHLRVALGKLRLKDRDLIMDALRHPTRQQLAKAIGESEENTSQMLSRAVATLLRYLEMAKGDDNGSS